MGPRRDCFSRITAGRVTVNGKVQEASSAPIRPGRDTVAVDGSPIRGKGRKVYLKLNKPLGIVSTTSDELGRRTVLDLIPGQYHRLRLYPVGRLDADTEGLLLLTNDGDFAYKVTHPRFGVEKEYHVMLDARLTGDQRRLIEGGVEIEGRSSAPCRVRRLPGDAPGYSVTLHEGRKRQVRRMFEGIGHTVVSLKRVRIGTLKLGRLAAGRAEELTAREVAKLMSSGTPAG